ncbi:hypothetical protein ACFPM0_14055 [Pseudonocardia sulfidoxydans]|uniref:hypothetical protein n=1 Tax=Pseudonocardia sulfidoxydans TaxID=54011 RepID=UPI0036157E26
MASDRLCLSGWARPRISSCSGPARDVPLSARASRWARSFGGQRPGCRRSGDRGNLATGVKPARQPRTGVGLGLLSGELASPEIGG